MSDIKCYFQHTLNVWRVGLLTTWFFAAESNHEYFIPFTLINIISESTHWHYEVASVMMPYVWFVSYMHTIDINARI